MKPSDDWLARLALIIKECRYETGTNFDDFMIDYWDIQDEHEGAGSKDYYLAKAIIERRGRVEN